MSKAQKNFLSGALILTIANALAKIIGAIYKIPLNNMLGTVGTNYYNDGYQIYALLFVFSTAGIPVAIAKMVSESVATGRTNEPKRIFKNSLLVFGIVGLVLSILLILFVEPISSMLLSGDTVNYCIAMIAPAIFFVAVSSVIKGYFQGYKDMRPSAYFQVIEAGFKLVGLVIVILMIYRWNITDPVYLACGGILGVTFGSFAASLFMLMRFLREKDFGKYDPDGLPDNSNASIVKTIITLAIPISLSSAVMSVTSTLDMIFVKFSLQRYGLANGMLAQDAVEMAKDVYGAYIGSTSSLFNLPPTITITVGIAVLPFLTSAFVVGKMKEAHRNMRSAAKVVSLIAMPCALGMSVMSEGIIKLLFKSDFHNVGIPCLRLLAISIFFVSFVSLTSTFLQSVGKVNISLITMGIGAVMKLVINLIMVEKIGIMGAPMGTFACYGSIFLLNCLFIKKYMKFAMPLGTILVRPFICTALCCLVAWGSWKGLVLLLGYSRLWILVSLMLAVAVYAVAVLAFKVLSKEDMILLPKGEKIGAFLKRKGWLHE
ncbi:MAG: polysaccharide biosynthesis protein [Clostridia bacterium]|nr:polysaccharide biosynthesis protein [Clostridia bacterium]